MEQKFNMPSTLTKQKKSAGYKYLLVKSYQINSFHFFIIILLPTYKFFSDMLWAIENNIRKIKLNTLRKLESFFTDKTLVTSTITS